MALRVSKYDPEVDAIAFNTGDPHDEIDNLNFHVLDYDSATYKPTSFELVLCASGYIPLSPERGYDPDTDTLTFGKGMAKAELVVENDDLVAHWGYAEWDPEPDFYTPVAVELGNASKHLARMIASISRRTLGTGPQESLEDPPRQGQCNLGTELRG